MICELASLSAKDIRAIVAHKDINAWYVAADTKYIPVNRVGRLLANYTPNMCAGAHELFPAEKVTRAQLLTGQHCSWLAIGIDGEQPMTRA